MAFLHKASGVGGINMLDRLVGLLLGILLARWLGADGYGSYAFVMASVVLLLVPVRFGLPNLVMRDIAAARAKPQRNSPSPLIKRAGLIVFVLGVLAAILSSAFIFFSVTNSELRNSFLVGVWLLPVLALLDVFGYSLLGLGRAGTAKSLSGLLPSVAALAAIATLALAWQAPGDAPLALGARLLATLFSMMVALSVMRRIWPIIGNLPTTNAPPPGTMLRAGLPFLLIGSVAVVMSRTDIVMLGLLAGPREAGIYRVALQGAMLVLLVPNTANTIIAPEFARLHAIGDMQALQRYAVTTARVVAALAIPIAVGLVIYGEALLIFLFGPTFGAGSAALPILAIGYVISLLFGAPVFMLNMTGNEGLSFRLVLATAVLNIILNLALIPLFGLAGAAVATVIALNAQKVLAWRSVHRVLGISSGCLKT